LCRMTTPSWRITAASRHFRRVLRRHLAAEGRALRSSRRALERLQASPRSSTCLYRRQPTRSRLLSTLTEKLCECQYLAWPLQRALRPTGCSTHAVHCGCHLGSAVVRMCCTHILANVTPQCPMRLHAATAWPLFTELTRAALPLVRTAGTQSVTSFRGTFRRQT